MQINSVHADMVAGKLASLYVPSVNLAVAYRLYQVHGWQAWSTYNNGKYKEYL